MAHGMSMKEGDYFMNQWSTCMQPMKNRFCSILKLWKVLPESHAVTTNSAAAVVFLLNNWSTSPELFPF